MIERKISTIIIISAVIIFMTIGFFFVGEYFLRKHSVLPKEERRQNMLISRGNNKLSSADVAREIEAALSKYTNWDNLFLSENFKEKYKNRRNILEDVNRIGALSCGVSQEYGDDVVLIFAEKKNSIFDRDESDDITTLYYFKYILDDIGEIDDIEIIDKYDVYTIDGMPVDSY